MQFVVSIHVRAPAVVATGVTFVPASADFVAPVPAGTVMGYVTVSPANWQGVLTVSGPAAGLFTVDAMGTVRAAADLAADDYSFMVDPTP